MPCTVCKAPVADMYTPDGDVVCKRCFYADDTRRKESGAARALISSGYAGIVVGSLLVVLAFLIGVRGAGRIAAVGAVLFAGGVASLREGRRRKALEAQR